MTPDPLPFTIALTGTGGGTLSGSIDFKFSTTGIPVGGTVLAGTVGGTNITLVFDVTVTSYTGTGPTVGLDAIGAGITLLSSTGAGWIGTIADGLVDITSVSGTSATRIFNFGASAEAVNPNVNVGETSNRFFISFASLTPPRTINFMLSPTDGTPDVTVSASIVPEPGSMLLLGAGLAGLAARHRRGKKA